MPEPLRAAARTIKRDELANVWADGIRLLFREWPLPSYF